jgi:hypothetical protein
MGDGVSENYDSAGVFRVIGLDEQVYKISTSQFGGIVPSWNYINTPLLTFKKSFDADTNYQAAIMLG